MRGRCHLIPLRLDFAQRDGELSRSRGLSRSFRRRSLHHARATRNIQASAVGGEAGGVRTHTDSAHPLKGAVGRRPLFINSFTEILYLAEMFCILSDFAHQQFDTLQKERSFRHWV